MIIPLIAILAVTGGSAMPSPVDVPRVHDIALGDHIADWGDQGLKLTVFGSRDATLKPFDQFGVTARLGWDDDGLLAQFTVTDPTPWEENDLTHIYNGDSVEIFFGTSDKDDGLLQYDLSPGRTADHPTSRIKIFDYRSTALRAADATGKSFCQATKDGYMVDLLLPWSNFKVTPKVGDIYGVRLGANDGVDGPTGRESLYWMANLPGFDFFGLPAIRLAEAAGQEPEVAAWGQYDDDLKNALLRVVATASLAGHKVDFEQGGKVRASAVLATDGPRSSVSVSVPAPSFGHPSGDCTVLLDGAVVRVVSLPDVNAERKRLFESGGRDFGRFAARTSDWLVPRFDRTVFTGEQFPAFGYPDPQRIQNFAGDTHIETAFYDAQMNKVDSAKTPGRYGAVVTVSSSIGSKFTIYRTLYRAADTDQVTGNDDAATMAATSEGAGDYPAKADQDWWHALRKKLKTAIKYEYYVHLPNDYNADKSKNWPVIYYLHGSGGGEAVNWDRYKTTGGPAGMFGTDPKFGFVVVSLRSPGGWYPPAVMDVVDEVQAKYRVDPAHTYLSGFSMGGMGTWMTAYEAPERFAAIAIVAGGGGNLAQMKRLKDVPVWIFNGESDTTMDPTLAEAAQAAIKAAGGTVKLTLIPGAGHGESLAYAYVQKDLYTWFLEQHR